MGCGINLSSVRVGRRSSPGQKSAASHRLTESALGPQRCAHFLDYTEERRRPSGLFPLGPAMRRDFQFRHDIPIGVY